MQVFLFFFAVIAIVYGISLIVQYPIILVFILIWTIIAVNSEAKKKNEITKSTYDPNVQFQHHRIVHPRQENSTPVSAPKVKVEGGVYLIKSGKYYKIGKAVAFDRRIKQIKLLMPDPVEVVHKIYTLDASELERKMHRKFASKRKNGEWFELSDAEVAEFKRY